MTPHTAIIKQAKSTHASISLSPSSILSSSNTANLQLHSTAQQHNAALPQVHKTGKAAQDNRSLVRFSNNRISKVPGSLPFLNPRVSAARTPFPSIETQNLEDKCELSKQTASESYRQGLCQDFRLPGQLSLLTIVDRKVAMGRREVHDRLSDEALLAFIRC